MPETPGASSFGPHMGEDYNYRSVLCDNNIVINKLQLMSENLALPSLVHIEEGPADTTLFSRYI